MSQKRVDLVVKGVTEGGIKAFLESAGSSVLSLQGGPLQSQALTC